MDLNDVIPLRMWRRGTYYLAIGKFQNFLFYIPSVSNTPSLIPRPTTRHDERNITVKNRTAFSGGLQAVGL